MVAVCELFQESVPRKGPAIGTVRNAVFWGVRVMGAAKAVPEMNEVGLGLLKCFLVHTHGEGKAVYFDGNVNPTA